MGEGGHDVVVGVAPLVRGQLLGVPEHVPQHGGRPRIDRPALRVQHRGARLVGVLVADDALRPVQQQLAVTLRHAQQVGEVEQGVVVGHGGDQIDGAVRRSGCLQGVREERAGACLSDPREAVHATGGEGPAHQPPQAAVARRILIQHHATNERQVVRVGVPDLGGADVRGVRRRVLEYAHDVGVPGHRPEPGSGRPAQHLGLVLPGNGVVVTQDAIGVVGHAGGVLPGVEDIRGVGDGGAWRDVTPARLRAGRQRARRTTCGRLRRAARAGA